ncbi:MAG: hypothetical protein J6V37_04800, partial [Clostridia bacterium]|nr:hypothetical protein [Clostridia bacterium]
MAYNGEGVAALVSIIDELQTVNLILADKKVKELLKCLAFYPEFRAVLSRVNQGFDYQGEKKKALTSQMVINALDDGVTNSKQLTIRPVLQREVTSILERHADTNYTGRGWAVVLSVPDGAVLAMADCGAGDVESRPLAVRKFFDPGHTISPFTVAAA